MASRGVNKVILIGNVGKDPDVRYFPDGTPVASLSLATSETWKDKNTGEPQERTEWHRLSVRGKLAEVVQQYVHKGAKLYVEGQLQTRKWQGHDGQDRYTTEVVVGMTGTLQMLSGKDAAQNGTQGGQSVQGSRTQPPRPQAPQKPSYAATGASDDMLDDEIPF